MRSATKTVQYESISDLLNASKEIAKEEHRYQHTLKQIVTSAFGTDSQKGLIPNRIEFYYRKSPLNWAEELDSLTRLFSPSGQILSGQGGLIATADYTIQIDPKILPKSVLSQFSGQGDKHSEMLKSLKRQLGDKYFINNWEWFWANVAYALVNQPEIQQRRNLTEDEEEDELFYMMSRNPYLAIARKALLHNYRKDNFLLERVRGVFELYIIEELLFATRRREGRSPDLKYQLKSHYLCMMFLLINSRKGKLSGQTMEIYQEYFLKATEYYSTISSQTSNQNIRNIIRVWTYLLTREVAPDGAIVKQLQNSNSKDGWYRLSRCPLQQWLEQVKRLQFYSSQLPAIISVRKNIYRLLGRHNQWTPNFSFLAVLEQFLQFDKTVLRKYVKRQAEREEDETISRCFERILVHLAENGANCQSLAKQQEKLNSKYKDQLDKKLNVNFSERSEEAKQRLSKTNREKAKSISYQSPRIRNVWQHPLQQNQYYILFTGAYWLSRQLDKLVPGHSKRTYPCINIRILSNPFIFLLFFIVVAVWTRSLFS